MQGRILNETILGAPRTREIRPVRDANLRTDMLQLADRLTVPQIFVNGHHVAGASELAKLREDGELQALLARPPHERADDPRLRRPDYEPQAAQLPEAPPEPRTAIAGADYAYGELAGVLAGGVEAADRGGCLGAWRRRSCFPGRDLTAFLAARFGLTPEEALRTGRDLATGGVLAAADGSGRGFSADGALFRLQVHEQGMFRSSYNAPKTQWNVTFHLSCLR